MMLRCSCVLSCCKSCERSLLHYYPYLAQGSVRMPACQLFQAAYGSDPEMSKCSFVRTQMRTDLQLTLSTG